MAKTDVGLSVLEGVSSGVTPFIEASKHNIGLLMCRERGVPGKAHMVTSLQEDRTVFGGIVAGQYGAYVARHIFNNAGIFGAVIYGVRILDEDNSSEAQGQLRDGTSTPTLVIEETQASGGGSAEISTVTPASVGIGDEFTLTLDEESVSFTATAATEANVIAGLIAAITAERASNPTGNWATYIDTFTDETTHIELTGVVDQALDLSSDVTADDIIIKAYAGYKGDKDPGTWGNNLQIKFYPKGDDLGEPDSYVAEVFYKGKLVENHSANTWALLVTTVNALSQYVVLELVNGDLTLTDVTAITLTGGTYTAPTEDDFYADESDINNLGGLAILNGKDIQLIANSEFHTTTMAQKGEEYCSNRADCLYVFNMPYLADDTVVDSFATALQVAGPSFCAGYNFWVKTTDEEGGFVWTPSIGVIIGSGYIRVPNMNRNHIWIPPAGVDSSFKDTVEINPNNLSKQVINRWVRSKTTNVAVFQPGKGFILWSSRTMATNPLYHSAHIRRMTSWMIKTLQDNLLWTVQKPNTPELKRDMIVAVTMWLKGVYQNGGLENSIPFEESAQVTCDKTNNPASQDRKQLNMDVNWIPTEVAESVGVRLNRNDGMLITKELES